jgi:hypothetical protein
MKMRAPATKSPEEAIVSVSSTPVRSDYARMRVVKSQSDLLSRLQCFLPCASRVEGLEIDGCKTPRCVGEFWTSKQRQAASISEISYRACFKPQLPRFFIELLTQKNDTVYDPFSGRGTTVIEAGLLGRGIIANDANPLSAILARPRFAPPDLARLETRLAELPFSNEFETEIDLSMFFHPQTLMEIISIRNYLEEKRKTGHEDDMDRWIRMVTSNRLTGHSTGFFSVYTLPPNQAVSPESQIKINQRLRQEPEYRDTKRIILKKTQSLLRNLTDAQSRNLRIAGDSGKFLTKDAADTGEIASESVQLTVTSPPFLDVVQYSNDNWLRCWFNNLNAETISKQITVLRNIEDWRKKMSSVFEELFRVARPGGWVAFEVGEVRNGKINLDEYVVPLGMGAGFNCAGTLINQQTFTKTANIWGVKNNKSGTNTNRIVLFRKG